MIKFLNKHKKQSGLTLLEALMSTAIVGIGFVAIFQMVNFSVQSIDTSGERTKANYLVSMIAEDIIGHRNTLYGINTDEEAIAFNAEGKPIKSDGSALDMKKFAEHLSDSGWKVGDGEGNNVCANKASYVNKEDINNLYVAGEENIDAPRNKERKWDEIFGSDRYLKCKSKKDIKNVKIFKICKWGEDCQYVNENVYDDGLFIGRVQVNINDGKKRKFLYFTADYQLRK